MSDTDSKRSRIKDKIAASQARLRGESPAAPPVRRTLPDAHPPQDYRSLAAEYPMLTVATGLAIGLLAGALVPKRADSRLGRRALAAATTIAELGLALSKQTRNAAENAAQSGSARISNGLGQLGKLLDHGTADYRVRARQTAGQAAVTVRRASQRAARAAQDLTRRNRG